MAWLFILLAVGVRGLRAPRAVVAAPRFSRCARFAEAPDFLITDSTEVEDGDRPSLAAALANPRDALALSLLAVGARVAAANAVGAYDGGYVRLEVAACCLGVASFAAAAAQLATGSGISPNRRRGVADDAAVNAYAGSYSRAAASGEGDAGRFPLRLGGGRASFSTAPTPGGGEGPTTDRLLCDPSVTRLAVSWLALRASEACPPRLASLDGVCAPLACAAFAYGIVAPAATLLGGGGPRLTATETTRVRGLVAIGLLGAVFVPDCVAFGIGGEDWWDRVAEAHPAQRTLESSTALFALFATEASMVAHRAGKTGVAPFASIVPAFVAVCALLAVAPCAAALYWLGEDVSFFSFYRE